MDHKLYKSQVVMSNQRVMINVLGNAVSYLGDADPTWTYDRYKMFFKDGIL